MVHEAQEQYKFLTLQYPHDSRRADDGIADHADDGTVVGTLKEWLNPEVADAFRQASVASLIVRIVISQTASTMHSRK